MGELVGRVVVEASISPSEDPEKVAQAVKNVAEGDRVAVETTGAFVRLVSGDVGSLRRLRDQLRDRRIRAAARRLLLIAMEGDSTKLMLNRQAAFAGVVAVCSAPEESPLGPIYVTVRSARIEAVIDWLTAYVPG